MDEVQIDRYVAPKLTEHDALVISDSKLRPTSFTDFPGQDRAKENLAVYVQAAKKRGVALDHVLLHGPPGLGKTSLAKVVAQELEVDFQQTSGPAIDKPGDLAGILAGLKPRSVLFIDEIHRLSIVIEEILYSAMEDFCVDIVVGQAHSARTIKMPVNPFTLIGATTRVSLLSSPLVNRFGIQERFNYYEIGALQKVIERSATIEDLNLSSEAARQLALRSRGTPRIANRLLRRVRDFAVVNGEDQIDSKRVDQALASMEINKDGLDRLDRLILWTIKETYSGGPVGIETLAQTVGEDKATLEEVYEPYLVHNHYIKRGPRGRELTEKGRKCADSVDAVMF